MAIHVFLSGQLNVLAADEVSGTFGMTSSLVQHTTNDEVCVPLFTCSKRSAPSWIKSDNLKKDGVCTLHIDEDLNANGIDLKHIVDALLVIFGVRTTFLCAESHLTYRIIMFHQNASDAPVQHVEYPVTNDIAIFMFQNSQRLPPDLSSIIRKSSFSSPFIRRPVSLPHPLVSLVPVIPPIAMEVIQTSSGLLQTPGEFFMRVVNTVFDTSYQSSSLRILLPTVLVDGVEPLYVWTPPDRKRIIIAALHPDTKRELFGSDTMHIYHVGPLQYMVQCDNYDYDVFLVLLPPYAVAELMDYDDIQFVKGPNGKYAAQVPVREWLFRIGKIPSRTICNTLVYAVCDIAKQKVLPQLSVQPGEKTSVDMFCGSIVHVGNTTASIQLLNSRQRLTLFSTKSMQLKMYGCYVLVKVGDDKSAVQVSMERFDEIQDPEFAPARTTWDPSIVAPVYSSTNAQAPIAFVTNRGCKCYICKQLLHDGVYRLTDVKSEDVMAALSVAETPYHQLLAFLFHVRTTFGEVVITPPQQIVDILTNVTSHYVNLRVKGLPPLPELTNYTSDTWTKSIAGPNPLYNTPGWVLIGNKRPILGVRNVHSLVGKHVRSDGFSWFMEDTTDTGAHPLIMLIGTADVQKFVKVLPSSERVYSEDGSCFVHSTTVCSIMSTYTIPEFVATLAGDTYNHNAEFPLMPSVVNSERLFYDFDFTGVVHTFSSGQKVFCRNIRF